MAKGSINKQLEEKLISAHIFVEKGKFFAGLGIILLLILVTIGGGFFKFDLPANFYYGFIVAGFIAASSKIKSYKDIINFN